MRSRSILGMATAVALAAAALIATPASAANATFTNPLATPSTSDLDIVSVDTDFSSSSLGVTAHTQNLGNGSLSFFVYVTSAGKSLSANNGALSFGGYKSGGSISSGIIVYDATGSAVSGNENPQVTLSVDPAGQKIRATIPTSLLLTTGPVDVFLVLDEATDVYAGSSYSGSDFTGLGPVRSDPASTTTSARLTFPTQSYGGTPTSLIVTVTPATAAGAVQVVADGVLVATVPVANGTAVSNLPATLSSGAHAISATYVPADALNFATSSSAPIPLTVISAATVTKTTVTLSKKSQTFKKKSTAKVKVVVSPKAVGTVTIFDGKKKLKTVTLKSGKASYTLSKSLKKGTHKIKAVFTPTDVEAFTASTSKVVKLTVKK